MEAETTPPAPFRVGDLVRRRGNTAQFGTVAELQWNPELEDHLVRVKMGRNTRTQPAAELELLSPDGPDLWQDLGDARVAPAKSLRLLLAAERLRALPHPLGERFIPARARFLPWQYKPMLRMLDGPSPRLLVADDDCLGKTLEAGYVIHAWITRRKAQRVLVAVPEEERMRWRHTLEQRLGIPLQTIDARTLRLQIQSLQRGWGLPSFYWLVSLEALARPDLAGVLEAIRPTLDLVVIDEAHRLPPVDSPLYRSATVLARGTGAMLLLTGTPVRESVQDVAPLLALLEPDRFTPTGELATDAETASPAALAPHISRTRVSEIHERLPQRVPLHVPVPASDAESALYALLEDITRVLYEAAPAHRRADALLALQAVASSLPAGTGLLHERFKHEGLWIGGLERANEIDEDIERPPDLDLRWEVPTDVRETMVDRIDTLMRERFEAYADHKLDTLIHVLTTLWQEDRDAGRPERKVVIFTRFRRTLRYLAHHLTTFGFETRLLAGIIPLEEQRSRVHEFLSKPELNVLLTTELGGEGLDLQSVSALIHYDLPWDPAVLERRIARIDRIGQRAERVVVITLVTSGTLEERVLLPLYGKLGLFQEAGGGMAGALEAAEVEALLLEAMRRIPVSPTPVPEPVPTDAGEPGTETAQEEPGAEAAPVEPPPETPAVEGEAEPMADRLPPLEISAPDEAATREAIDRLFDRVQDRAGIHHQAREALERLLPPESALNQALEPLEALHRMPAPAEARTLVMSVLLSRYVGVWLKGDPVGGVAQLDLSLVAVREIKEWAKGKGARAERLAGRLHPQGGPLPVTLSPDVAMNELEAELLQAGHPLVRFALEKLEPDLTLHGRAFAVAMPAHLMPAGRWLVGIWSLRPGAAEGGRWLEPIVCAWEEEVVRTGPEAEALLSLVIGNAQELDTLPELDASTLAKGVERLQAGFAGRLEAIQQASGLEPSVTLDARPIAAIWIEVREAPAIETAETTPAETGTGDTAS